MLDFGTRQFFTQANSLFRLTFVIDFASVTHLITVV